MEPKANPVATGALAAGIVPADLVALAPADRAALAALAPADLVALAALAPADLAALAVLAPVVLAALVALAPAAPVALVALAPVVTAVTVDRARRVDLAAAALLASRGIPRADPDVMDPVVARVVRISILNR
jgi:hypothetical protein